MKQNFKLFATLAASAAMMISCQQAEEPTMDKAQEPVVKTRAYGDKTPKVTIYVETNDMNPLNAGDYLLSDGSAYADIVEFFAANLNKETVNGVVRPTPLSERQDDQPARKRRCCHLCSRSAG